MDQTIRKVIIKSTIEEVSSFINDLVAKVNQETKKIKDDSYAINMILNETLYNALEHGNAHDETKKITIEYLLNEKEFYLSVLDEGNGFDWKTKINKVEIDLKSYHGRGVPLLKKYSSKIEYNEKGNLVKIWKYFQ